MNWFDMFQEHAEKFKGVEKELVIINICDMDFVWVF